jgi:hypothetical protein
MEEGHRFSRVIVGGKVDLLAFFNEGVTILIFLVVILLERFALPVLLSNWHHEEIQPFSEAVGLTI